MRPDLIVERQVLGQHREKLLAVLVIQKDVLPSITPGGDVIERAGEFEAEWPGHLLNLAY
jgi:hypothetical protein